MSRRLEPNPAPVTKEGLSLLYAFIDESERNEEFYFLGAAICTATQGAALSFELDKILQKYSAIFPSLDVSMELHGNEILAGRDDWKKVALRARFAIFKDAMTAIADSGICLHLEGIDIEAQKSRRYRKLTPARELALSHLLERINECAGRQGERVTIYADEHHTKETSRSNFASYRTNGTYGYKSSKLPHIEDSFEFIDSHSSRVMQAADMATYLYNRIKTIKETDSRADFQKYLLWSEVLPAVLRGNQRVWP